MFDKKQNLDLEIFNILSHISIPSLNKEFSFLIIEGDQEREGSREMWG